MEREEVRVPASVPDSAYDAYIDNYLSATHGTGKLMLFAGDQKIEHLNEDFSSDEASEDDADPQHLLRIASQGTIGVFAAQHGLISSYAQDYPDVDYLVKINSKTNLVPTQQADPVSQSLVDLEDVLLLRENGVRVAGVGYTVYLGSEYEASMLAEAGRLVAQAHEHGLLAVIWMYPRGKAVDDEKAPELVAGATGVGCSLGADFVKVSQPEVDGRQEAAMLKQAVKAAGRTGVIVSGGSSTDPKAFLQLAHDQLQVGTRGTATGRNIHQKPLDEAVRMTKAISSLVYGDYDADAALRVHDGEDDFST